MRKPENISEEDWERVCDRMYITQDCSEFTKGQIISEFVKLLDESKNALYEATRIRMDCQEKIDVIQTKMDMLVEGRLVIYCGNGYNGYMFTPPDKFAWMDEKANLLHRIMVLENRLSQEGLPVN